MFAQLPAPYPSLLVDVAHHGHVVALDQDLASLGLGNYLAESQVNGPKFQDVDVIFVTWGLHVPDIWMSLKWAPQPVFEASVVRVQDEGLDVNGHP